MVTKRNKIDTELSEIIKQLSTFIEKPLKKILQIGWEDRHSVSMYYSRQLFEFVKAVLYVIPVNIFTQLNDISKILSVDIKELEVRISKDTLKENANNEKRFILA